MGVAKLFGKKMTIVTRPNTEARNMDPFKKRLYDEFEDHAFGVLGVSGDRGRKVSGERGHDIDADFEVAYNFTRADFMR